MQPYDKNFIIMCVLLGVAVLVSCGLYFVDFDQNDSLSVKDFPRTIGSWTSKEIPLTQQDFAILETDNAFVRKYTNPQGQKVYLYVVYSQNNRKVVHPPEICYIGSGVTMVEKTHDVIAVSYKNLSISTNRLLLQSNQLYQITFYWFKVGDVFTSNYWKEQMLVAFNSLKGKRQSSALIRISADLTDKNSKDQAIQEVKEFTNLSTPQFFKHLP